MADANDASRWIEEALDHMSQFRRQAALVQQIGEETAQALNSGRAVFACGNGGSASQADHLVTELVVRFQTERRPLPAISLNAASGQMTALSNDYSYDDVFVRQIDAFGEAGDILMAFSTSGKSPNVLKAAKRAGDLGMKVFGLSGKGGGGLQPLCDLCLTIESDNTAHIQEMHLVALHAICLIVDGEIAEL